MTIKNNFFIGFFILFILTLVACTNDDNTSPIDPNNPTNKTTFTGIIKQNSGNPLPGVNITLKATGQTTVTDSNGIFILPNTLPGNYVIEIDGSAASGDTGSFFGTLNIATSIGTDAFTSLNQIITLPNLNNALTAQTTITANAGNIAGGISATNGSIILDSNGADVIIKFDGVNLQGSSNVSATPVSLAELPMPLPTTAGANASSFVTIQPPNATFNPPLDLTIPNDQNLPPGTLVDIYSFDHNLNNWVNRSTEFTPARQGVVSANGALIEAKQVISKGGWHGPVVNPNYIETVVGIVMNGNTPLQNILIFTSTGQQGITDVNGRFSILVPVFGTSINVSITATSNGFNGAISTTTPVQQTIDDNINLDLGTLNLSIPSTGIVSGIALQTGTPSLAPLVIFGDNFNQVLTPDANGAFMLTGLTEGTYTASTIFNGDSQATTTQFNIVTGKITVITLENTLDNSVIVKVSLIGENFKVTNSANDSNKLVTVTLSQGSTAFTKTTDANGLVTFNNVTGMVTITGQMDKISNAGTSRLSTTIHDIIPFNGQVELPIVNPEAPTALPIQGTTIEGALLNIPAIPDDFELIVFAKEKNDTSCCDNANVLVNLSLDAITNGNINFSIDDTNGLGAGDYTLIAVIRSADNLTGITRYISAAVLPTKVTTTAGQTISNINLNFADPSMKFEFITKNIIVNNSLSLLNTTTDAIIENIVLLPSNDELNFTTFKSPLSAALTLPSSGSFISTLPGGARVSYDLGIDYIKNLNELSIQNQNASLLRSTATTATFNLINTPVITSPTENQVLTLSTANNMTINWSDVGSTNFVSVTITSLSVDSTQGTIDASFWIHYLSGNSASLRIPSVTDDTLSLFTPNSLYVINIGTSRLSNIFNFNQLFNFNFNTNVNDLLFNSNGESSSSTQNFSIVP